MNKGSAEALRKSYLVDLTQAMRKALLDENATLNTARALLRRGMVSGWDLSIRDGQRCVTLSLTDLGKRTAEAIRAEMDATPIIPAERVAEIEEAIAGTSAPVERTAEAIRVEMDATPIITADGMKTVDEYLGGDMITVSVPKHLADAVTAAWSAVYSDDTTTIREVRKEGKFEALGRAYLALREAVDSYQYLWLSRALLDAAQDAQRQQDGD